MIITSLGQNINNNRVQKVELKEVLTTIQRSNKIKQICEAVQSATDNETKTKIKETLPYAVFSEFDEIRRREFFKGSNGLVLDIDDVKYPEYIKSVLKKNKLFKFIFVSPSGNGLKVGIELDKLIKDPSHFSFTYKLIIKTFEEHYGLKCCNTSDCTRPCFLSYDPNLYYNENAVSFDVPVFDKIENTTIINNREETLSRALVAAEQCKLLGYHDWIKCGFALKQLVDDGLKIYGLSV